MAEHQDPQFHTTQWSMILAESQDHADAASATLVALCEAYRFPVLSFLRRKIANPELAEDLCQDFFTHLIEKKIYRTANPARGRFRTFLLTAVENHLRRHFRDSSRQKRGSGIAPLSLEDEEVSEPSSPSPEDARFDHDWAVTLFDQVWTTLREEHLRQGTVERFDALQPSFHQADDALSYKDLAEQFDLSTSAIKSSIFRMRSRFREIFRETVALLVEDPTEIDGEINYLMSAIAETPS